MSERLHINPEHESNPEALEQAGNKERERIQHELEKNTHDKRENLDEALKEARERAQSTKHEHQSSTETASPEKAHHKGKAGKKQLDAAFNATMDEVQAHMTPEERAFSKVIHNKTVEKVSDGLASTVARPNAILSGAVAAFLLTLGVYVIAKNLGYPLSGFETIAAFALGWVLGLTYDFLKVMVTGRK